MQFPYAHSSGSLAPNPNLPTLYIDVNLFVQPLGCSLRRLQRNALRDDGEKIETRGLRRPEFLVGDFLAYRIAQGIGWNVRRSELAQSAITCPAIPMIESGSRTLHFEEVVVFDDEVIIHKCKSTLITQDMSLFR